MCVVLGQSRTADETRSSRCLHSCKHLPNPTHPLIGIVLIVIVCLCAPRESCHETEGIETRWKCRGSHSGSNACTGAREEEEVETRCLSGSSFPLVPAFRPCPFPFSPLSRLASILFPYPRSRDKTHAARSLPRIKLVWPGTRSFAIKIEWRVINVDQSLQELTFKTLMRSVSAFHLSSETLRCLNFLSRQTSSTGARNLMAHSNMW